MSMRHKPGYLGARLSLGIALTSLVTAAAFLALSTLGMTALREGFEGLRPMIAAVGVLCAVFAALMVSIGARGIVTALDPASGLRALRPALSVIALASLSVATYVFVAAAPGGPPSQDSWGEVIAAVLGLWFGLTALAMLSERLMWLYVAVAGLALLSASVVV